MRPVGHVDSRLFHRVVTQPGEQFWAPLGKAVHPETNEEVNEMGNPGAWLVFTLQIWTKVILAQWNFPNSRSWGQDSCPPGYSQKFGITCLFTLICLFPQHIPPLELPSWELEHHYMLSQHHHTEGFNNSAFKIIISYEWDRRGSNSWEWMNNWRNKLTSEKQRFSVVQRIEVVWFDE